MSATLSVRYFGVFSIVISGLALSLPSTATSLRFSETAAGSVIAVGNTLGLSKAVGSNAPGTSDAIGAFTTLNAGSSVGGYPAGTTLDWTANGSTGRLNLPDEAEVLYAELVWGGKWKIGNDNVGNFLESPVTLSAAGASLQVTPSPATRETLDYPAAGGWQIAYYLRSADVTSFVQRHGREMYSVQGVPAVATGASNTLAAAGWTLIVAYRDVDQPIHNLTVFVGGDFVDEDAVVDYVASGFCTPPQGSFDGHVVITAMEGDANRGGDGMEIGASVGGTFVELEGLNNPRYNFFASAINGSDSDVDTSGTFGLANHDTWGEVNISAGRQGWDVTRVPVSSNEGHLVNGQTSAVLRTFTVGDSFFPTAVAFSIGVNAPNFTNGSSSGSVAPLEIQSGGTAQLTVAIRNTGDVDATDVSYSVPMPDGLVVDAASLDGAAISGVTTAALVTGIPIGTVPAGGTRTVVLNLRATSAPANGSSWSLVPRWRYQYVSCVGQAPGLETATMEPVILAFNADVNQTDTDTDVGIDTGLGGDDTDLPDLSGKDMGGCACSSGGGSTLGWLPLIGLLALRRRG